LTAYTRDASDSDNWRLFMGEKLKWTESAEKAFEKVPPFVREMARRMMEDYAEEKGVSEITPEILKEARAKYGM